MSTGSEITLGIEEEFFLVDRETLDLVVDPDSRLLKAFSELDGMCRAVPELLRSQIELNSLVCHSVAEAREAIVAIRRSVLDLTDQYGIGLMASSTHPFAAWETQAVTPRDRYREFAVMYQSVIRQLLASGMHVHAGFGTPDERVQVMTAMRSYLPLFLTLSGSSPFSGGHVTGFKSSRMNLMAALPRSGMPPVLSSWADYDRIVDNYRRLDFVRDGSEIWWDLRPSVKFPTLELRIADVCPDIDDGMSIVALYTCLVRHLLDAVRTGPLPVDPPPEIIQQNRWLAQRYGVVAFLADFESGTRVDLVDYVDELLDMLSADAAALDCQKEVAHVRNIIREGSSADRQLDHFRLCRLDGAGVEEALRSVAQLIVSETRRGAEAELES
ncbi:MAG: carboxylate-amine ligase [Rhodospirillales bacterium]|nr:carboxylate-amine ligase [Rhodospirillales bacterium]MCY4002641.1 carboxylate-amine ligase [Rhodospirillales bacterium]MDE0374085.1 carboxylate-amine ligase [Rhodospirillales bacterium]MXX22866.1 carboxylate-amine ligase [Rhodospirillales bacterium]MYE20636.1 carboxylate-amine ligase [Rhodospirillales bacterium]